MLAVQRGELDGYPGLAWVSAKAGYSDLIARKELVVLAQSGFKPHPQLPDVPVFPTGKTDADHQLFRVLYSSEEFGRPFAFPPDVPDDRVQALRKALEDTVKDPEFITEAAKVKADLGFVSGEELEKTIAALYATPPEVIARLRGILGTETAEKAK